LEAEVVYLYIGGVAIVVLSEILIAIFSRKKNPRKSGMLLWHTLCTMLAFTCLGLLLFGAKTTPDGGPYNGSGLFALFGIFWFIGEMCLVNGITSKIDKTDV